jgi:hypothetical protein
MAVYVDNARLPYGRMMMCHMVADSREELDAMADRIGVKRKWIQKPGTPREHYDICLSARAKALAAGAKEIGWRELGAILRERGDAQMIALKDVT